MGRRIVIKKIQNITSRQVTFSKRRTSLIKKASELALCCNVDVAFIAYSPSGRVTKFCTRKRLEELIILYANLPADQRLEHISDVEEKLEKLQKISHIYGDKSKLQYLDKQIENLELQIQKGGLELQIVEANLRDYEIGQDQEAASLHQISWCERNLQKSLEKVTARRGFLHQKEKIELQNQPQALHQPTLNENGRVSTALNPFNAQLLMQLDPWISPFSAKVRETILQDLIDQSKHTTNGNPGPSNTSNFPIHLNISNFPSQQSSNMFGSAMIMSNVQVPPSYIPIQQPLRVDHPLHNFHHGQMSENAWNNNSSVPFSEATQMTSPRLYNTQDPRFTSITASIIPNMFLSNMASQDIGGHPNGSFMVNGNPKNDNVLPDNYCRMINWGETQRNQLQDVRIVHPHSEASNGAHYRGPSMEATNGDNSLWAPKAQRNGLLDWEDWLLDDSFNFQHN